jgi:hypothetical protein
MSLHFRLLPGAATRQASHAHCHWCFLLIATALTVQGCAAVPPRPLIGPDASDPDVRVPSAVYRSALSESNSARPSEPAPWRERSHGTTPEPKKDEQ